MSQSYQQNILSPPENQVLIQKKLRVVNEANKYDRNQSSKGSKVSLYSTAHSQVPYRSIPVRINLSSIKRNSSIPYICKASKEYDSLNNPERNYEQVKQNKNYKISSYLNNLLNNQQTQQQYILSPTKFGRSSPCLRKRTINKCITSSSAKQKVVIISSSNCKIAKNTEQVNKNQRKNKIPDLQVYQNKQFLKVKIRTRIKNKKQVSPSQEIKDNIKATLKITSNRASDQDLQTKKIEKQIHLTQSKISKVRPYSSRVKKLNEQKLIQKFQKQDEQINMQKWLLSDLEILKLFPQVDLSDLVTKIKIQEQRRKLSNINKWKQFDYCNVSYYDQIK